MKLGMNIFLCAAVLVCVCYRTQAAYKDLSIYIRSEGCDDPVEKKQFCGAAIIRVNGIDHSKHIRGYNVVVLNGNTGIVESSKVFDTWGIPGARSEFVNHLHSIAEKKIVLIASKDSAERLMNDAAYDAIEKFGASSQLRYTHRSSFALLGWSGPGVLDAVTQVQRNRYEGPSIISKVLSLPLF